jgi:hypothetical protein
VRIGILQIRLECVKCNVTETAEALYSKNSLLNAVQHSRYIKTCRVVLRAKERFINVLYLVSEQLVKLLGISLTISAPAGSYLSRSVAS